MATRRFYAYYIRGGQLAIVEHDNVSGSGQTLDQPSLDDIGPSGALSWKSPVASITDGLEIEYAYSPRYSLGNAGGGINDSIALGDTKLVSAGWYVSAGKVHFVAPSFTLAGDLPSISSNWPDLDGDDYVVIENSNKWNGIHKVDTTYSNGHWSTDIEPTSQFNTGSLGTTINVHSDGYLYADDGSNVYLNLTLSVGDMVIVLSAQSGDTGIYEVTSITETDGGAESTQRAYLGTKYFLNREDDRDEFQTGASHFATDTSVQVIRIVFDPCYATTDADKMDDESDVIDLPEYLSKALVYYVKSKLAEDAMDLEQKEYYMREFNRIIEKHESSKIWGPRIMVPGSHGIR